MSNAANDPVAPIYDLVVAVCAATLLAALLWLAACTVVCLADRRGGRRAHGGPFRPRIVQAVVAVALGSSVVTGSAAAGTGPPATFDPLPRALDGLPLPDRAYGGVRLHVVQSGESLWAVAAQGWPRLFRLNRDRLGSDPDLVHPGTRLRLPPRPATTTTPPAEGASR